LNTTVVQGQHAIQFVQVDI